MFIDERIGWKPIYCEFDITDRWIQVQNTNNSVSCVPRDRYCSSDLNWNNLTQNIIIVYLFYTSKK